MEITGQEIIDAQKRNIGDLQHQNLISQLAIQKLQAELDKYKPKEPLEKNE